MPTSDSRSNNGCWTCRARRKKCDESSQRCQVCARLHLTCYGYGNRPIWMDGSCNEKEKILEFKAAVKRNLKLRRKSKAAHQQDTDPTKVMMEQSESEEDQTQNPLPSLLTPAEDSSTFFTSSTLDGDESIEQSTDPFELLFSSQDLGEYMNLDTFDDFSRVTDFQHMSQGDRDCSGSQTNVTEPLYSPPNPNFESADALARVLASTPNEQPAQWETSTGSSLVNAYFQDSFRSLFPFLEQSASKSIICQLSMLAACSRLCLASLALYRTSFRALSLGRLFPGLSRKNDKQTSMQREDIDQFLDRYNNDSRAVSGAADVASDSSLQDLEAQIFVAQMIHCKVICEQNTWPCRVDILASLKPLDYNKFLGGKYSQLTDFQSLLINIDIFASTSTGEAPSFALKFRDRFRTLDLSLEHVIGCKSGVMECIMDMSDLQAWNYQQSLQASPSLIEIARRALKIEQKLETAQQKNHVEASLMDHQQEGRPQHYPTSSRSADIRIITNVFACAASVYLHVIVSGAHPKVPEIEKGVTETIQALSCIPDTELVKGLTWPICISACMADGDQHRGFFERLEEGIIEEFGRTQRVLRAFRVARECWRLRDTKSGNSSNGLNGKAYNWRDSMESLRERLLLL